MYGPRSPTSSGHTAPKKLLEKSQPMDQPVDNFMAWEAREGRLEAYVLLDEGDGDDTWSGGIVTQLDFTGDSDIRKSDGGDQGHDPTEYLAKKATASTPTQPEDAAAEAKADNEGSKDALVEAPNTGLVTGDVGNSGDV